ncbi:type II secretion system protein [Demequina rhizosphaerae]|uniref:type II secretion system protein n=1 Tax=Demequina rhizosphaerae TaxID=1638985 RepID=UPI000781E208|nr:prepilin-type N-terminal cleavage/methylation domain-containing protein [Demequina rhizosphaerae]
MRGKFTRADEGFTLVELLVTMVIIAVLAALALPLFLTQRQKANDTAARADLTSLGTAIAAEYKESSAAPSVGVDADQYKVEANYVANVSDGVEFQAFVPGDETTWCVWVKHAAGDVAATGMQYSAAGGLGAGTC